MAKRIDVRMTAHRRDALRIKMPRSNPRKNSSSISGTNTLAMTTGAELDQRTEFRME